MDKEKGQQKDTAEIPIEPMRAGSLGRLVVTINVEGRGVGPILKPVVYVINEQRTNNQIIQPANKI